MPRLSLIVLAVLALSPLVACKKAAAPIPATTPAAATAPAPAPEKKEGGLFGFLASEEKPAPAALDLGEFEIVSVRLGSAVDAENNVDVGKDVLGTKDAIYAAVLSQGKHQGLKMSAKWTTADGQLIADTEQVLVPTSATVTTFSVRNPEGWPVGKYRVQISVDGQPMQTRNFEVR
ncbi:hypothetical protein [Arenimonas oryziterrae]|uniref:DUF4625 domain-containing protein n=1 Tax=Arenimonas oryziterrae DSM 21050 = YC6267 TaxID=1121015 RepID=A0A091AX00_9GAMM|nr:hypothetical protein [Arenimonas oryziterrae]KFN43926.1 hypothetical protein N789_08230 [Arenimonas oryziterrae DSM 21050 = YC6267]